MHTINAIRNGGTLRVLLLCTAALLCMSALAAPVLAACNLKLVGSAVPNVGPATLFANEANPISVTNIQCIGGDCPATTVSVTASDGWSGTATVPAMAAGSSQIVLVGTDPTIRTTQGTSVTYTAVVDPSNTVAETDETDNTKTSSKTVTYNGYKGAQYWTGKESIATYLTYDLRGDVIHSFGDSYYKSGKGSPWTSLTWHWTADDLPVPTGATVRAVRLYIPYCWDYEDEVGLGTTTTTLNGVTVAPVHRETDTANFGVYAQYKYGLITYDVTNQFLKNQQNTVVFTRSNSAGSLSPAGFTLAVIYEDSSATRRQIFINEGWDLLGASSSSYGTTEAEATSTQAFTGMAIAMGSASNADLTTFVPWGAPQSTTDTGEGNLFVNGVQVGTNVWNYGDSSGIWGENGMPQVAVDTRDVLSNLNAGGTGNTISVQSTTGGSPCMVAERSFLIVEYPDAPVANFAADTVTPSVGQTVTFTDQSAKDPTSWDLDFGDSTTHASGAGPWTHAYTTAGTYSVTLTVSNTAGSDTETKTDYITVSSAPTPIALPGFSSPPTDPDSDGLYEDVTGNGLTDFPDVQTYFKQMDWIAANEPIALFDYSHSSLIDFPDVQLLFKEI